MNGEKRNAYTLFVGRLDRRRPLGRTRCRLADNIQMDLGVIEWGYVF
jgi:hypothetical protein